MPLPGRLTVYHYRAGSCPVPRPPPSSTQGSQFFVTTAETSWLDGKHVVFGEVTKGMNVVTAVEALGTPEGTPSKPVVITACGEL